MLATTVAMAATPALACQVGPPQHHKGPLVFLDYDQLELDASYDQVYYEPLIRKVSDRLASNSESKYTGRAPGSRSVCAFSVSNACLNF